MSEEILEESLEVPKADKVMEPVEVVVGKLVEVKEDAPELVTQKVISGPKKTRAPKKSNVQAKSNNAIGSGAADRALARKVDTTKPKRDESEMIALWSDKNIRWSDVGTICKGYNIVSKEAAVKWTSKAGIREATPEEVATYYGA